MAFRGHGLITGPTGAGKSTVLRALLDEPLMAPGDERVQVYVLTSGRDRDWRPWANWATRHAAEGDRVATLDSSACRLAPFQTARFLCQPDDDHAIWDPLGDLIMTVNLMLANQYPGETLRRGQKRQLRQAILTAAHQVEETDRHCRIQDVLDALRTDQQGPDALIQTLEAFCQGALGEVFNAEDTSLRWEADSDIVLIDPAGCCPKAPGTSRDALEGLLMHDVVAHVQGLGGYEADRDGRPRKRLVILDGFPSRPMQHGTSIFKRALARSRETGLSIWLGLKDRTVLDDTTWSRLSAYLGTYIGLPHGTPYWLERELEQAERLGPHFDDRATSALHRCLLNTSAREPWESSMGVLIDLAYGEAPALFHLPDVEET
ncbi:hypothetical protein [Halomonas elongata]|nr:hypothetical protein [Halomonas elongata]WBF17687.1 hypothetical protein LM502_16670 [Halomonas elongata]WPU46528.1 hypothetical protein SR933_14905 [Halomonas elongata DSM 2581]